MREGSGRTDSVDLGAGVDPLAAEPRPQDRADGLQRARLRGDGDRRIEGDDARRVRRAVQVPQRAEADRQAVEVLAVVAVGREREDAGRVAAGEEAQSVGEREVERESGTKTHWSVVSNLARAM